VNQLSVHKWIEPRIGDESTKPPPQSDAASSKSELNRYAGIGKLGCNHLLLVGDDISSPAPAIVNRLKRHRGFTRKAVTPI
jgi:hypothetical protein